MSKWRCKYFIYFTINANEMTNHFTFAQKASLCCNHRNGALFTCEDIKKNMLFSHEKISCFRVKEHLAGISLVFIHKRCYVSLYAEANVILLEESNYGTLTIPRELI